MSVAGEAGARACPACGAALVSPLSCSACGRVMDVEDVDEFDLLGLPRRFDVDVDDLRRRYLAMSRLVHPDRVSADVSQQAAAQRASAVLNRAYRTLSDEWMRADALLQLAGGPTSAAEKTVEPGVLAETLELREAIDEASAAGDAAGLDTVEARVRGEFDRRRACVAASSRALPGDEGSRRRLRIELNSIRYFQRMLENLAASRIAMRSADGP